jgi:hypothetical protein
LDIGRFVGNRLSALGARAGSVKLDALRETPFWDQYFEVVAILPSVENSYTDDDDDDD